MVQGAALLLQGVSAGHLPDSGVTAAAKPALLGQSQLEVTGHEGLAQEKRKSSKSGIALGLQEAFLAQTC